MKMLPETPEPTKKTPVIAIAALVNSLLIPFTFGLTFSPAFLLGLHALAKTFPNENTKRKERLAVSALVISSFFAVAILSIMFFLFIY